MRQNANMNYPSTISNIVELCNQVYNLGWGENHAGNISYILDEDDIFNSFNIKDNAEREKIQLEFQGSFIANKYLLVTAAGSSFRNIKKDPKQHLGIIKVNEEGNSYKIIWGFKNGKKPTSELPTHLLSHNSRLKVDKNHRIIFHSHPTYTTAMSFLHSIDEKELIKTFWTLNTECVLTFPEGVGLLPWMVCGNGKIGVETAYKMLEYRIVIWPFHGALTAGNSIDEALGLMETIEKAAKTFVLLKGDIKHRITDEQIIDLAKAFKLTIKKDVLT